VAVPLAPPALGRGTWGYGLAPREEWEEDDPHSRLFWIEVRALRPASCAPREDKGRMTRK